MDKAEPRWHEDAAVDNTQPREPEAAAVDKAKAQVGWRKKNFAGRSTSTLYTSYKQTLNPKL